MPWGPAIAAVGTVAAGAISSSASSGEGADTGAATRQALNMQKSNFDNTSGLEGNTITVGQNALSDITDLSGAGGPAAQQASASLFQTDPGYNFELQQGQKAIDSSAAARGLGTSGADAKGYAGYAEGLASQDYSNFYNRLSNLAGVGQDAIKTVANAGANAANDSSQTIASGQNQQNQITSAGASNLGGSINSLANSAVVQNALSQYASTSGSTKDVVNNFDSSDAADILAG